MKKTTLVASALMLALLSGCGTKDASEHYAQALSYIEQQQFSAAVIELKSAIQQAPQNAEYRLALGNLYLKTHNVVSAQKELLRAKQGGIAPEIVALNLVRASYHSALHEEVLSLYTGDTDPQLAEPLNSYLKTYRALSELELGATDRALQLFNETAGSEFTDIANFAQSNILIPAAQYADALSKAEAIATDSPLYYESLYLQANLLLMTEQYPAVNTVLEQYLAAQPQNLKAQLLAAQSWLKQQQLEKAAKHIDVVLKVMPEHAYSNYLKALTEFEGKQFTAAKELIEKAINNGYKTAPARIVAALSNYQLGLDSQALHHLSSIERQLDIYPAAKKLYIGLLVRSGNTADASTMLKNVDITDQDLQLVATTAFELAKQGSDDAARELVTKYQNAGYSDLESLTTMGMLKLGIKGQEAAGLNDLELALQMDPSKDKTRLVLAGRYLRLKQYAKAEELADAWLENPETAVAGYNLKAYSSVLQQRMDDASSLYNKALDIEPENPLANLLKATVLAYNKDYKNSQTVLKALLSTHPDYLPAISQFFNVSRELNDEASAIQHAEKVVKDNPENYPVRLFLARYQYLQKEYTKTLELLSQVDTAQHLPPSHWLMLINANFTLNKSNDAVRVAQNWFKSSPQDVRAAATYAELLRKLKRNTEALSIVEQQLLRQPEQPGLLMMKLTLLAETQQFDKALEFINQAPKDFAAQAEVKIIQGKVQLNSGQRSAALNTFLASYTETPEHMTALLITDLYQKDLSTRQAIEFLEQHMKQHGTTPSVEAYYANMQIMSAPEKAESIYRDLLQKSPDNLILLNNYAWMLMNNNKADQALQYAEQALKVDAENADVNDTYGAILVKLNRASDAISYFEKALKLQPGHSETTLNFAEALILLDKKSRAAELIDSVTSDDPRLTQRKLNLKQQL